MYGGGSGEADGQVAVAVTALECQARKCIARRGVPCPANFILLAFLKSIRGEATGTILVNYVAFVKCSGLIDGLLCLQW